MSLDPDLVRLLKRLKQGQLVPTLPERLALARAQQLDYAAFLTLLLADEVQRREQQTLEGHLDQAGFEERVTLDAFDWSSPVHVDRQQLQHVFTLQFLQRKEHVILLDLSASGRPFWSRRSAPPRSEPAIAWSSRVPMRCSRTLAKPAATTPGSGPPHPGQLCPPPPLSSAERGSV